MPKTESRPDRWAEAVSDAQDALARLTELVEEYQEWRDGLPENLEQSATAEKLDAIADLGVDEAVAIIETAQDADLPRGFGRD